MGVKIFRPLKSVMQLSWSTNRPRAGKKSYFL